MRAIYLDRPLERNAEVLISDDSALHLIKVIRVKVNQEILILNGTGNKYFASIKSISKKALIVHILTIEKEEEKVTARIDVALCLPKKEAFFQMVKQCCEMGIGNIIPLKSKYSQLDLEDDEKVINKLYRLVESAIIQANNPYTLRITSQKKLEDLEGISSQYSRVIYLCSHSDNNDISKGSLFYKNESVLIVIGPEAGLSLDEESFLYKLKNVKKLHLPTYIMRAPTALNVAVGYLLSFAK